MSALGLDSGAVEVREGRRLVELVLELDVTLLPNFRERAAHLGVGRCQASARTVGAAADDWSDDRRRLGQQVTGETRGLQSGRPELGNRVAVGVAACAEPPPGTLEAILPARKTAVGTANVLEAQEATLWFQHASDLPGGSAR